MSAPTVTPASRPRMPHGSGPTPDGPAGGQRREHAPAAHGTDRTTPNPALAEPQIALPSELDPPAANTWHQAVTAAASENTAAWVRAEPFRAHVRGVLADTGLQWRVLAVAAGVPPRVVHTLLFGRDGRPCRRIRALDAAALLLFTAGTVERLAGTPAPPGSIQTCLRTLMRSGHSHAEVAAWLRTPSVHIRRLAEGAVPGSSLVLAQLVAACMAAGIEGVRAGQTRNPAREVPGASLPVIAPARPHLGLPSTAALPEADAQTGGGLRDWAA